MRALILAVLVTHPAPVTTISGVINPDQSVTISWTLPADPSVVGVTILRERLDRFGDDVIFEIVGLTTTFTDLGADPDHTYRYWVHTRDASDDLSTGAFVEVIGEDDDEVHVDCHGSIPAPWSPWPIALAGGFGALAFLRRRR